MLGTIISAGASLLGGILANKSQKDANDANAELQREFAQNGIRWKVADAEAAGIHPLYALGAQTSPASPSYAGSNFSFMNDMGQDIGRAVDAKRTQPERAKARIDALAIERGELENQLLRSQISRINQPGHPPALPTGNSGLIDEQPLQPIFREPGVPEKEVGSIPDYGYVRTKNGYALVPSQDVKNRIEDQIIPELMWAWRNQILPGVSPWHSPTPPDPVRYPLPKGAAKWEWDGLEFRPADKNGRLLKGYKW